MGADVFPLINMVLIILLLTLTTYGGSIVLRRRHEFDSLWDHIEALRLRMDVQEKLAPCQHCRSNHIGASHVECEDC